MPQTPNRISGLHAIEEALRAGSSGVLYLSRKNARTELLERLAEGRNVRVVWTGDRTIARRSGEAGARGALLEVHRGAGAAGVTTLNLGEGLAQLRGDTALVLLLDGITDPHNLGAILRSADQLAVELVVVTARRSAGETETVLRTSAGASVYVPLCTVANLSQAIEQLKKDGFWVYGADAAGQRLDRVELGGRIAVVLGSEGAGLHRLVRERCDMLVRIPTAGHVDSFNVSVAAGILMFEVRRRQGFPALR
jgi:23S rRNA (guanosine2251-2'-O)-methyltransferase